MTKTNLIARLTAAAGILLAAGAALAAPPLPMLNEPIDVSADFKDLSNTYFLADKLTEFDPTTRYGKLSYLGHLLGPNHAFGNTHTTPSPAQGNEFPATEYAANPELPFSIEFISPRVVRIRTSTGVQVHQEESLMLAGPLTRDDSWKLSETAAGYCYTGGFGSVTITKDPWHVEFRDATGRLLTKTDHMTDHGTSTPLPPFSFVRRASDYSRSFSAAFTSPPGEKIFGCGESFTGLDKRGQKVVLFTSDTNSVQTSGMSKPIPFFMSSAGYGMFMHTTAPVTCDFGQTFHGLNTLMLGDDELDLFVILGSPKEILDEYTKLTGRPPMPPLWSFGLWMSSGCNSEEQTREGATKLRENKIPADVIHLDTGWFETDRRCDYQFSKTRFPDPAKLITDLKNDGFHLSLWQLPYFTPRNELFPQIIAKGLAVKDPKGNIPGEDAVLDFSNPVTLTWYQAKLAGLLKLGVSAINVDFGEAAPVNGTYASGRGGFYEHNLYPLRYNKAVSEVTKKINGDSFIWARSAWAGSQRYPLHWGGNAESTDNGMASELRGGLSLGLSGFSFWNHDAGGFTGKETPDLYLRWLAFSMLTSHSRCHGMTPKEPWNYDAEFMERFREIDEMRYKLMPYIYAQAKDSSDHGLPMLRALFVEYPEDPGSWKIEDEYLFGSAMLVAPLLHEGVNSRDVYLPPGSWIDYQTGKAYNGGWQKIEAGKIPIIMLVKDGTAIPHIGLAQSTTQMDWSKLELVVYAKDSQPSQGLVCLPADNKLLPLSVEKQEETLKLTADPLAGQVTWSIRASEIVR